MAALTQPELTGLLQHPTFGSRMVEIGEVTHDTGMEAGVAAYKKTEGRIVLSEVLHPDTDYIDAVAAAQERYDVTPEGERLAYLMNLLGGSDDPAGGLPELSLARLTHYQGWEEVVLSHEDARQAATNPDEVRTDLAVIAHSHPMLHLRNRDPRQLLLPSSSDIITSGDHMAVNPGLIEATTATHSALGGIALFMWRAGNETAPSRMQALRRGAPITENNLGALGLRTATVVFNRRTGTVRSGLGQLDNLFEPIPA